MGVRSEGSSSARYAAALAEAVRELELEGVIVEHQRGVHYVTSLPDFAALQTLLPSTSTRRRHTRAWWVGRGRRWRTSRGWSWWRPPREESVSPSPASRRRARRAARRAPGARRSSARRGRWCGGVKRVARSIAIDSRAASTGDSPATSSFTRFTRRGDRTLTRSRLEVCPATADAIAASCKPIAYSSTVLEPTIVFPMRLRIKAESALTASA